MSFLKIYNKRGKIYLLGAGSNTLFSDKIYEGVTIKLGKNFNRISRLDKNLLVAGGGVSDKKLSVFSMENEISGLEFLSCIPGSVGGGIKMNSGCYDKEFKDILDKPAEEENPGGDTLRDLMSNYNKQKEINDAVVKQAEADTKQSGYETSHLYTVATKEDGTIDIVTTDTSELDASTANELADRVTQTPKRKGYDGYLVGDGIAPNGEAFGHGISFPTGQVEGDYFLRTDMLPNRLFRYDGRRWVKMEDKVRMTMTNTDTRSSQKTSFINNVQTNTIADETVQERQSLSKALKPKTDN